MKRVYLEDIINKRMNRIAKSPFDIDALMEDIAIIGDRPSFYQAIAKEGLSIIGEIKKASPSKGLIKVDFNPVALGKIYEQAVDCISVLTEEDYFMGSYKYLRTVSKEVTLPTLYKDFVLDEGQIYQAKSIGASCILLIVAILSKETLEKFFKLSRKLGLDVLVEVHTEEEMKTALTLKPRIIGINNRNLVTFETTIETTIKLKSLVPKGILVISESGIRTREDILQLSDIGIDGILVGESFMKGDIKALANIFKVTYEEGKNKN